jgi:xylan 1,4-beta-xylosidase
MMSWWTFDDTFEEDGPVKQPFYGGFGLLAAGGIKKPSYNAFALLHRLGEERLANPATDVLVTRRKDGTLVIAVWNLVDPGKQGSPKTVQLELRGVNPTASVAISRLDAEHGNTLTAYEAMGKPRYPTQAQIRQLNQAAELLPPERLSLQNGRLTLRVPVDGLAVVELSK